MNQDLIKRLAFIGVILIAAIMAGIIFSMTTASISSAASRDSFISAFGGAAFAYLFVRLGEFFNAIRMREKLNHDTLVEIEHFLNQHLGETGHDIDVTERLIENLTRTDGVALNFFQLKPLNVQTIRLQDLNNIDLINDLAAHFSQLRRVDENASSLQGATEQLRDEALNMPKILTGTGETLVPQTIQEAYQANASEIAVQVGLLKEQYEDVFENIKELIAKVRDVETRPNLWLSLPTPMSGTHRYDPSLPKRMPELLKEVELDIEAATKASRQKYSSKKTKSKRQK